MRRMTILMVLGTMVALACEDGMYSATDTSLAMDTTAAAGTDSADGCTIYLDPSAADSDGDGRSVDTPLHSVDAALDRIDALSGRCAGQLTVQLCEGSRSDTDARETMEDLQASGATVRFYAPPASEEAIPAQMDGDAGVVNEIENTPLFSQPALQPLSVTGTTSSSNYIKIYNTANPYLLLDATEGENWYLTNNAGTFRIASAAGSSDYFNMTTSRNYFRKPVSIGATWNATMLEVTGTESVRSAGTLPVGTVRLKSSSAQYLFLDGNEIDSYSSASPWNGATLYLQYNAKGNTVLNANGGNVGIGITAPTHKLTVNGTIKAEELLIDTVGGADFVFEDGYNLMCIDEVEQFVEEHHHLPGIASAADMQRDGVSMGDFQIQLLQKIEELTLHLIDQNRRIREQENRIGELEQKCGR